MTFLLDRSNLEVPLKEEEKGAACLSEALDLIFLF